jgi:hypothetical protein
MLETKSLLLLNQLEALVKKLVLVPSCALIIPPSLCFHLAAFLAKFALFFCKGVALGLANTFLACS